MRIEGGMSMPAPEALPQRRDLPSAGFGQHLEPAVEVTAPAAVEPVRSEDMAPAMGGAERAPLRVALEGQVDRILADERALAGMIEAGLDGRGAGQRDLLRLQMMVYGHVQRVEVATRLLDRVASGLKQLLNTQI